MKGCSLFLMEVSGETLFDIIDRKISVDQALEKELIRLDGDMNRYGLPF